MFETFVVAHVTGSAIFKSKGIGQGQGHETYQAQTQNGL